MKNNLKIIVITSIVLLIVSCDNDDDGSAEYAEGNAFTTILNSRISLFDTNTPITLNSVIAPESSLNSIEIYEAIGSSRGEIIADADVSDLSSSFSSSALLPFMFLDDEEKLLKLEVLI